MKILISSDGLHAHFYQRSAWAKAFEAIGIQAELWDCKHVPAFHAFEQFEPDLFLGQSYNLDPALIKCIKNRPHLRVGLRAGDWGTHEAEVDKSKYNILFASQQEKDLIKKLKDETRQPEFVHIHYDEDAIKVTHNFWEDAGIPVLSLMMCADVHEYLNSSFDPGLQCDIGFVGGYWPYKAQIMDAFLMPLCYPVGKYNIKIFGNQPWTGVNQYCGMIMDHNVKNLFKSAAICPNFSEPHAPAFGFEVNERIFKVLCAGGFTMNDNVASITKIFGDSVPVVQTPEHFEDRIDFYLENPTEKALLAKRARQIVLDGHTNFHRASSILNKFKIKKESKILIDTWQAHMEQMND